MNVEIPFSQWARGQGEGCGSYAHNGQCCAMGFVLKAFGFTDLDLDGKGSFAELNPTDLATKLPDTLYERSYLLHYRLGVGTIPAIEATRLNDDPRLSDDERMERLALLLEPLGIDLIFIKDAPSCM